LNNAAMGHAIVVKSKAYQAAEGKEMPYTSVNSKIHTKSIL